MYSVQNQKVLKKKDIGELISEYGTIPLIITAPHGGWKKPESIPDRVRDGSLTLRDLYTKEIAESIHKRITQHYRKSPFVVLNLVSRRKVDTNRPIDEGTETEEGRELWLKYHNTIKNCIQRMHENYEFGILIDIHGQTHEHGMVELGYLLKPSEIKQNSTLLLNQLVLQKSSIQSLAQRYQTIAEPQQLLRLLGDKIKTFDVSVVPSTTHNPDDLLYFHGAYTTETYHFHNKEDNKGLDTIQIEIPQRFRLGSEGREQATQAISKAIIYLLDNYYINKHKL